MLASIPSPSDGTVEILGLSIHMYGVMIALGVIAGVWLSGRPDGRGEQQIHQCDAGDNAGSGHDAVLPFEKPRQRIRTVAPHACAAARGCPDDHTRVDGATLPTQDK